MYKIMETIMINGPEFEEVKKPEFGEIGRTEIAEAVQEMRTWDADEAQLTTLRHADLDPDVAIDLLRRGDADNPLQTSSLITKMEDARSQERYRWHQIQPELEKLGSRRFTQEEVKRGIQIEVPAETGAREPFRFGIKMAESGDGYILFGIAPFTNEEIINYTRFIPIPKDDITERTSFGRDGDLKMPDVAYNKTVSREGLAILVGRDGLELNGELSTNPIKFGVHQNISIEDHTTGEVKRK
jgi:hypothetical protein